MNRENMLNHLAHTLPNWPDEYVDMIEPGHGWAWYDEGEDCTLVLCKGEEEIREADYAARRAYWRHDMNRDELLDKLAMELGEWPSAGKLHAHIGDIDGFDGARFVGEKLFASGPMHRYGMVIFQRHSWLQRRTELINKPSWDDAPEWAQWLAQDKDGVWHWYSGTPEHSDRQWDAEGELAGVRYGATPAGHDWRDTLEKRPKPQSDIKKCKHCDVTFQRPHLDSVPDDCCTRCDEEIKAVWAEHRPTKAWWTSKACIECGRTTATKVSDDRPVCPGCVAKEGDPVNHPAHYTNGAIECIDALEAATVNKSGIEAVCTANAIKYLWRYESKGGAEDVRKARWYIDRLLVALEEGQ